MKTLLFNCWVVNVSNMVTILSVCGRLLLVIDELLFRIVVSGGGGAEIDRIQLFYYDGDVGVSKFMAIVVGDESEPIIKIRQQALITV